VELGAVVVVPAWEELAVTLEVRPRTPGALENPRALYSSRVLGNDLLQPWMDRIRKLGVQSLWLTSNPRDEGVAGSALAGLAREGIERLLVIKLKSYAEMDLADLLRFHCEARNPVTETEDARGQLGVCVLDHLALHASGEKYAPSCAPAESGHSRYQFRGYAKRILSARERQELVGDALTGACAMRPLGTQIREQVWVGEGVNLAGSVRVIGPTYIGARTIVRAGATIGPFASVEHDCVVDCGTTVERSTVLPYTYLAPGLLIRHQLVDGGYLEDLNWGTVADLQPTRLGSRIQRRESRRYEFRGRVSAWDFAPSSMGGEPWLKVML
jgi:carbonic anhydrase/acetyltransferase-like protein (isoleucine patch superfamily)